MSSIPFNQRFGIDIAKPIDNDVPKNARIALAHFVVDLDEKNYLKGSGDHSRRHKLILGELNRCGRFTGQEFEFSVSERSTLLELVVGPLLSMKWWQVYTFFERCYGRLLDAVGYWDEDYQWVEDVSIAEVKKYYTDELNTILAEENLAYHFVDGAFQRRGRAQTQKSAQRVGKVLADSNLIKVLNHYNKAQRFFDERPEPDIENCVKEALCALEACLETLTGKPASKNFARAVKQRTGNNPGDIPPPIAEGLIKLHAYRGSGQGVAHAALQGSKVSEIEAELVLSLVATYVTYLVDLLRPQEEEIPF
jgi:hypothetical protein